MKRLRQEILLQLKKENKSFWNIMKQLPITLTETSKEINLLHKEKIVETKNNKIQLTKKGADLIKDFLTPIEWNKNYQKKLLKKFLKKVKNRPLALDEFDQGIILPENTIERAVLMGKRFDIDNKKILVIGDDDLVSIALALTERAEKIIVLEADKRITDFINSFAEKNKFPLKAIQWNVEKELPIEFKKQFDVFLTDPVETIQGIKLFLGRGMSSLKGIDSSFYFGLSSIDAGKQKWLEIQKIILNAGFIFTEIIRDQAIYPITQFKDYNRKQLPKNMAEFPLSEPETYFRSNLIRCLAVKKIKPLIKGKTKLKTNWYFDNEAY